MFTMVGSLKARILFLAGFLGALVTAILLLVIKSGKGLFTHGAFLFHFKSPVS